MAATTETPSALRTWVPGAVVGTGAALLGWVALDAVTTMWPRMAPPAALALAAAAVACATLGVARFSAVGAPRWALLATTAAIVIGITAGAASPVIVQVARWSPHPVAILARGAHGIGPYVLLGVWAALVMAQTVTGRPGGRG